MNKNKVNARSIIEACLDPLIIINTNGKITHMNHAFSHITGISLKNLAGTFFFEYFTEPQKAQEVYQQVFSNGSVTNFPLIIHHKNGKFLDVLINGSVYKDNKKNVSGAVVVVRDVTEQKRIAAELNKAKLEAERATEIAETSQIKAESATRIAEDAVKAKQQFLSNMSHEIRTPMNAIIGFTKVLLRNDLTAKQKEYLAAIKLSGDSLIVLINDILDLSKVDSGKMTFEQIPFKMALSISAMLHLFEPRIQEKNLLLVKKYDPKIPKLLLGDPVRLHQIILNLVNNAIKFTSKGQITVSIQMLEEDDEQVTVEFAVVDTGIGIAEDKLEKIFENFQQAYSGTSRLFGGTGLGLAIVKQLVEAQGGTIHVISKINEGSTFSFRLNFKKTDAETEYKEETLEIEPGIKELKILVVEDIALNQLLMKTVLEDLGFECDIAANGQIAIDKLQTNAYDLILMDLQMPVMNGFKATEHIRSIIKSDIPIIALTADVTTVDLEKCKAAGMNDYIAKPVDERFLYNKIAGLVKKSPQKSNDKLIDLDYLKHLTKSNPELMMQMISLYLDQTPTLISAMKQALQEKNWNLLYTTVHKLIPSFSIMGINSNFENMAKQLQELAYKQFDSDEIPKMVLQIDTVCQQTCKELETEFIALKNTTYE
jgi:PAS domain S-box-containing protein